MGQEKIKENKVYESALLNHEYNLFETDEEKLLLLAYKKPEAFKNILFDLENSLRLYFSEKCDKNKQGEFLEKAEELLSILYGKLPEKLNKVVGEMIELILDHYSENKDYYAQKKEEQREYALKELLKEAGIKRFADNKDEK